MELAQKLKKLGLSEKETQLYLASLRMGLASITELVRASGLKRATAYLVMEELVQKNLLRRIKLNKKWYYQSQKPEVLRAKIQEKSQILKEILPQLNKLVQTQSGRPQVQVLEGREGIRQIYKETHKYKEILFLSDIEQVAKLFGQELKEELAYQAKHKIKVREIVSDTAFGRRYAREQNKKKPREEVKILMKKVFTNDNLIYGDILVIFSMREGNLFAVKIVSREIAQSYRMIFESLWEKL